jgi:DNA primase
MKDIPYSYEYCQTHWKPDIITILQAEGIVLKQKGKNYWALCPLHTEKNPSFKVDLERQRFHCFGCGASGDVIAFIQAYTGLSFKNALSYLRIDGKSKPKPDKREIRKRKLLEEYKGWKDKYLNYLCDILRRLDQAKLKAKTMKEVEAMAFYYHSEPIWEHHFEILFGNDEMAKFELYKEFKYGRK